jgi:hypothetical protein
MPSERIRPGSDQVNGFHFDSSLSEHCPEIEHKAYSEDSTWPRRADSFGEVRCNPAGFPIRCASRPPAPYPRSRIALTTYLRAEAF